MANAICPKHHHQLAFEMPDPEHDGWSLYSCPSCQPMYRIRDTFSNGAGGKQ